jgi:hypothetical protein
MRSVPYAFALAILATPAAAQGHVQHIVYTVHHSLFGDVGTLTRDIKQDGEAVTISTRADVHVELLGVSLHRMQVAWDEAWSDGCLKDFRGRTVRNGETSTVHAWSDGAGYIVESDDGRKMAPSGLQPIAPWSIGVLEAAVLMSPESGKLYPASVQADGSQTLKIAGAVHRVEHYVLRAGSTNHLYFDEKGLLVASEYADITGKVTISAKKITAEDGDRP